MLENPLVVLPKLAPRANLSTAQIHHQLVSA